MLLQPGESIEIPFVLVKADGVTPVENAQNMRCKVGTGDGFTEVPTDSLRTIGGGWYAITIPAKMIPPSGWLVLTAKADDSLEWRDIHQVATAAATPQPPEAEPEPPEQEPEPGWTELRLPNLTQWHLHCAGEIVRTAFRDGASYKRHVAKTSNCQTYTVIGVEPGEYRLSLYATSAPRFEFGVALHQHGAPYAVLGLDVTVPADGSQYSATFTVAAAEAKARLRIWLGDIPAGGELQIDYIRLERRDGIRSGGA